MNAKDAIEIIEKENLKHYRMFENIERENEVVIRRDNAKWIIYITDERASIFPGTEKCFDNESDALDYFIKKLRLMNKV